MRLISRKNFSPFSGMSPLPVVDATMRHNFSRYLSVSFLSQKSFSLWRLSALNFLSKPSDMSVSCKSSEICSQLPVYDVYST